MATSIIMGSGTSDRNNTSLIFSEDLQTSSSRRDHQPAAKPRRNSSRVNEKKKKQPQRGMGVAQLENLRIQERWKKITETVINDNSNNNNQNSSSRSTPVLPFTIVPTALNSTVPLRFAKFGADGTVGLNLIQQGLLVQRVGNNNGLFQGQGLASDDKFQGYLYGVGNSKELSSTPKVITKCYNYQCCGECHKKKRNVTEGDLVFKGVKNAYTDVVPISTGNHFLGFNGGNQGFGKNVALHARTASAFHSTAQGVEVVAFQRNASTDSERVMMEYDFFPGKERVEGFGSELVMMKKKKEIGGSPLETSSVAAAVLMGGHEIAASSGGGGAVVDASNSIDLSLRLSY